jgi:hypothetical protein
MPGLTIGDTIPNLELDSTQGRIRIHDFVGDGYAIIFSHPGTRLSLPAPASWLSSVRAKQSSSRHLEICS